MNNFFNAFLISTIAGLSTLLGSLFIFFKTKNINKFISLSLAFSSIVMIIISVFDLIPASFYNLLNKYNYLGIFISILSFIFGHIVIKLLNIIINRVGNKNSLYIVGILSMISLILHNIPEGVITFITSSNNLKVGIKIAFAIALHNIPEGISISVPIYYSTKSYKKAIGYTLLSGLSELFGALVAYLFLYRIVNDIIMSIILIFVAGIMITLAISEILKESISYSKKK